MKLLHAEVEFIKLLSEYIILMSCSVDSKLCACRQVQFSGDIMV